MVALGNVSGCRVGDMCGCEGDVHGCRGCVVAGGHVWLPGGRHGCWGGIRVW